MKWISFKEQLPTSLEDILIWDNDPGSAQRIAIGFLADSEFLESKKCDCGLSPLHKEIFLTYYYTWSEPFELILTDVLNKDFYWRPMPEFKI